MKPNPLPFLREKWAGVVKPTASFAGRRVLVTGANTGIGFEAAATLASLDADHIILAVRNIDKGMEARRKIEARGQGKSTIQVWELDMGDYENIKWIRLCLPLALRIARHNRWSLTRACYLKDKSAQGPLIIVEKITAIQRPLSIQAGREAPFQWP